MIELVLTVCLAQDATVCADRLLPDPAPVTATECEARAAARVARWQADNPAHIVSGWTCTEPGVAPLSITEVAPGVWVHKGLHEVPTPENAGDLANIGFIVGQDAVAVIDAGGSRDVAEGLLVAIRDVTDLPVKWLVLSHMHPDHVMGASLFHDMGAQVVGHTKLADGLVNRSATYQENYGRLIGAERMILSDVIAPEVIVSGLAEIDLGGRVLILTETVTAHTDNDLRVFDVQTATVWTGDLVFAEHTPALDGSILGWIAVLEDLTAFEADRLVPGHGPESLSWPDGMAATHGYLVALAEETRAAIDAGESLSHAITHLGESQRGDWLLFDEFNARNATAAFTELEWE